MISFDTDYLLTRPIFDVALTSVRSQGTCIIIMASFQ